MLRSLVALAMLASLGISAPAFAQDGGVAGEIDRVASSSPQEKLDYVASANDEMRTAVKEVGKLLETVRREADVERIQCLKNRFTSLRSVLQVSEGAETSMRGALEAGEVEKADHEFRKVAIALSKARQLRAEADGCGYDSSVQSGETEVIVEGGEFDDLDETVEVEVEVEIGFDPPESSPFM